MTKFFLPKVKDQKGHYFKNKKKIVKTSCNQSLFKTIFDLLQKLLTRQKQKSIRKIKQSQKDHIKSMERSFQQLKQIKKDGLKQLSYYILKNQMNVEEQNLHITLKIQAKETEIYQKQMSEGLKNFYISIKNKQTYKKSIKQIQKTKTQVKDKKRMKKQKLKIKKQSKLKIKKMQVSQIQLKKSDFHQNQQNDVNQQGSDQQQEKRYQSSLQQLKENIQKPSQLKIQDRKNNLSKVDKFRSYMKQEKKMKTQFKKTGRNKALFQKKNKNIFNKQSEKPSQTLNTKPKLAKDNIPDRHQTPHPSWQAKRQIKNQMFIQPFLGKKILL